MTLNREKMWHVSKLTEPLFKGELHCSQGCFRKKPVGRMFKLINSKQGIN